MDLPTLIRNRLIDLERRYSGPIPRAARQSASLPSDGGTESLSEIEYCVDYFSWLAKSRSAQMRYAARWAIASRGQAGLTAIIDRERFEIACRRLREARLARDAWAAARVRASSGSDLAPPKRGSATFSS